MELADDLLVFVEMGFCIYVYTVFFIKANECVDFVEDLKDFTIIGKPKKLEDLMEKQNRFTKIAYAYTLCGTFLYTLASCWSNMECERKRIQMKLPNHCALLLPVWLPFDLLDVFVIKMTILGLQVLGVLTVLLPAVVSTYFAAAITEHVTLRVSHLREIFADISYLENENANMAKLINCIKCHIDILR